MTKRRPKRKVKTGSYRVFIVQPIETLMLPETSHAGSRRLGLESSRSMRRLRRKRVQPHQSRVR
jgi:hypothetical protein